MHVILLLILALLTSSAHAQTETDLKGAQDHPLLQRFTGAWLVGYQQLPFDQTRWATSGQVKDWDNLKDVASFEGRITRLVYITPKGKTPLEVYRNHQQALVAAGFEPLWTCESQCDKLFWTWQRHLKPQEPMAFLDGHIDNGRGGRNSAGRPVTGGDNVRFWTGQLKRPDGSAVLLQLVTSDAVNAQTQRAATWVQILEPQAMPTGQVLVNAKALGDTLSSQGKVALYGLQFDTGKADIKPESQPQLQEMAKLLQSQSAAKVFIVGHTDNVGAFDANQALSLARAQAVVAALSAAPYKIDAKRLSAKGVANVAPVASNADEAGRAKNRRVEMVLQ